MFTKPLSDLKNRTHLNSDEHKIEQQYERNQKLITTGSVFIKATYVKYKIISNHLNMEEQLNQFLSQKVFPMFKIQVSCSTKFVEFENNAEIFRSRVKHNMIHNYESQDIHQQLLQCVVDNEQLEGSGFQ